MADISMCEGVNCPSKHKCYRHMAPKNVFMQSYMSFDTERPKHRKRCDDFISIKGRIIDNGLYVTKG